MRFLERDLVDLHVNAEDPEEAIREAGRLLAEAEAVSPGYVEAMVRNYREHGPYFVLAPHLAIPHARPEDGVKEPALSMIRLIHPVEFGHSVHDPVWLVFGLGASSSEEHLRLLQRLTRLLGDPDNVERLLRASDYHTIESILGGDEG
jgi:ascorbate PTS system EIIA or EIIAB component